ncbi:hypothetical protein BO70DRAFT_135395 [Aspergillus heteromorphus CBS 117.55]|uniref:Uncharacterized protein n=1 Tax=Aspergillus heteromorphus CBS 117.55 TaxID=1448321 RepID=A0A317WUY4_9EURO|nr:uncharacterized protein BO70DRAFT_135395 [Aspergillus heteromorphus CBS 117.55]PWY90166.1 hypothetical protein BO70DRAFT_135395 [Aspergillus heteromorphus CBS 117.55]
MQQAVRHLSSLHRLHRAKARIGCLGCRPGYGRFGRETRDNRRPTIPAAATVPNNHRCRRGPCQVYLSHVSIVEGVQRMWGCELARPFIRLPSVCSRPSSLTATSQLVGRWPRLDYHDADYRTSLLAIGPPPLFPSSPFPEHSGLGIGTNITTDCPSPMSLRNPYPTVLEPPAWIV